MISAIKQIMAWAPAASIKAHSSVRAGRTAVAVAAIIAALPAVAFAWGTEGHQLVAEYATEKLSVAALSEADQVDGEEPCRQRQLGVLHQTARSQRVLVSAAVALKQPACILAEDAVVGAVATRTTESIRLSRLLDRLRALSLSAEALKEFRNGHAVLEPDLVEGHGVHFSVRELQLTGQLAHRVNLA